MDTPFYNTSVEQRMIAAFRQQFFKRTGKTLIIIPEHANNQPLPEMTLEEITDVVSHFLPLNSFGEKISLTGKSRKREVVYLRMIHCKLSFLMGYPIKATGDELKRDHSTVSYGIRTADLLLNTKDEQFTKLFDSVIHHIKSHMPNETTLSAADPLPDYTEPVLPALSF